MKKKIFFSVLCILLVTVSLINICLADEASDDRKHEVVVLMDMSGSMDSNDPKREYNGKSTRISIEAVRTLADYCETNIIHDANVSLVFYNSKVYEFHNSTSDSGNGRWWDNLYTVLDRETKLGSDGFRCWASTTDIGSAMEKAYTILSRKDSSAQKSVLLFTDGKIELSAANGKTKNELEEESKRKSYNYAEKLSGIGAKLALVGLDTSKKGTDIDKAFLQEVQSRCNDSRIYYCTSAEDIAIVEQSIIPYFFGGNEQPGQEEIQVRSGESNRHTIDVYGGVFRQQVIFINSPDVEITDIKVLNPDGIAVSSTNPNDPICYVNEGPFTSAVRITNPAGGQWTICFTGSKNGKATVNEIILYDLSIRSTHDEKYTLGSTATWNAKLYNEQTGTYISDTNLFRNASFTATFTNDTTGVGTVCSGRVDGSGAGYDFDVTLLEPGTYTVLYQLSEKQVNVETEDHVTVVYPGITVASVPDTVSPGGKGAAIALQLTDPLSNKAITACPKGLETAEVKVSFLKNGENVLSKTCYMNSYDAEQKLLCSDFPQDIGSYDITAELYLGGDMIASAQSKVVVSSYVPVISVKPGILQADVTLGFSDPTTGESCDTFPDSFRDGVSVSVSSADGKTYTLSFKELGTQTVKVDMAGTYTLTPAGTCSGETITGKSETCDIKASEITMKDALPEVSGNVSASGDAFVYEINLNDYFTDSDGDPLVYEVSTEDGKKLTAAVKDGVLRLECSDKLSSAITLKASDGKGAFRTETLTVEVGSTAALVKTLVIVAGAAVAAVALFLIFAYARQVIRIPFAVRITYRKSDEDGYDSEEATATYHVANLSKQKRPPHRLRLSDIIDVPSYTVRRETDGDTEGMFMFIRNEGSKCVMKGTVMSKNIKIKSTGKPASFVYNGKAIRTIDYKIVSTVNGTKITTECRVSIGAHSRFPIDS